MHPARQNIINGFRTLATDLIETLASEKPLRERAMWANWLKRNYKARMIPRYRGSVKRHAEEMEQTPNYPHNLEERKLSNHIDYYLMIADELETGVGQGYNMRDERHGIAKELLD
jgi:hypothetical protein